jgi:hypothetical protein
MYDLIGDVHGHAQGLVRLLDLLGYRPIKGLYQHPWRKAIFVGDLINRGPESKEVLQLVRPMVQSKNAYAVLGNHEINLMAFYTLDDFNKPLFSHSIKNMLNLLPVFESFRNAEAELYDYIDWMFSLPLFLEFEDLRVVHACWHQDSIHYVRKHFPHHKFNRELIIKSLQTRGPEYKAVHMLVKGLEIPLPRNKKGLDAESVYRGFTRVKWWDDHHGKSYREISTQAKSKLPNYKIPANLITLDLAYPEQAVPVFFGHYSLGGKPMPLKNNVCCLDYGVIKNDIITAYRWNGELKLDRKNFIQS